jgi:hypothetical protein
LGGYRGITTKLQNRSASANAEALLFFDINDLVQAYFKTYGIGNNLFGCFAKDVEGLIIDMHHYGVVVFCVFPDFHHIPWKNSHFEEFFAELMVSDVNNVSALTSVQFVEGFHSNGA